MYIGIRQGARRHECRLYRIRFNDPPGFAAGLQKQWAVCQKFDTPPMNSAYRRNIGALAHNFLLSVDNVDAGRQLVEVVCTGVVKHLDSLQVVDSTQTGFAACVNRLYERG